MVTSYWRSEGKYLLWGSCQCCALCCFSTICLYSIYFNLTFTEPSPHSMYAHFWISATVLPGNKGGTKQQPGARFLTHCIIVTISLPWIMLCLFIFNSSWQLEMLQGLLASICVQSWPASHADCGLFMVFNSSTKNVGKVFYCADSFIFNLTFFDLTFTCSS